MPEKVGELERSLDDLVHEDNRTRKGPYPGAHRHTNHDSFERIPKQYK